MFLIFYLSKRLLKMEKNQMICEKHEEMITWICMSHNCQNNHFCNECIKQHNGYLNQHFKNIQGKSFTNEILHTNSLIEENEIKLTRIRDIFNENMKISLNLIDQRIKLKIEEITKLLNDHRNSIMEKYEKALIGKLDYRNLNIPKLINLENIKNLVQNLKDTEMFINNCNEYDEIKLKSNKLLIISNEINQPEIKKLIQTNLTMNEEGEEGEEEEREEEGEEGEEDICHTSNLSFLDI